MVIYMTINLINNKKYIGQDSNNNPNYLGGGVYLNKAIKKYGKSNFLKIILENVDNISKLNEREEFWIKIFNAHKSEEFYNLTEKGRGWIKNKKRLKLDHLQSKVNQYDLKGNFIKEWNSINDANEKLNIKKGSISNVCRGKYKSAGGYLWSYKDQKPVIPLKPKPNHCAPILQWDQWDITDDNNRILVKEWSPMKEAIETLKLDRSMLQKAINKKKIYKKYVWSYK